MTNDNRPPPLRGNPQVYTPLKGLMVASKLDTDVNTTQCRIAFYGRLVDKARTAMSILFSFLGWGWGQDRGCGWVS